jgi:hypothetical protein
MMHDNKWVRLLAYVTGLVNQRLLLQCEYLAALWNSATADVTVEDISSVLLPKLCLSYYLEQVASRSRSTRL